MDETSVAYLIWIVLALGVAAILYGTVAKTNWGINFSQVTCPTCRTPQPKVRKPADAQEVKWGGYTCAQCGTKMDKWGRVRTS